MFSCTNLRNNGSIAIIGAGPAGLMLARLLQMRGFCVTVFERDASATARQQGGSLDLHTDSGQRALAEAGLAEDFRRCSRLDGQAFKVLSHLGQLRYAVTAEEEGTAKPEIDRGDLRELLLHSLSPETVRWGQTLEGVAQAEDGRQRLIFAGQPDFKADFVIGCDGVRSKVREGLTAVKPTYVGLTMFENCLPPELWYDSELARLVGQGAVLIVGAGKGLWAQRNSSGALRLYYTLAVGRNWPESDGLALSDREAVLRAILAHYSDWSSHLVAMLAEVVGDFHRWPLYALPPDHRWASQHGLTILGDAAHVMPPFTGKGANMALLDALELADALTCQGDQPVAAAVAIFEQKMQRRMTEFIAVCMERMQAIYGIRVDFTAEPSLAPSQDHAFQTAGR